MAGQIRAFVAQRKSLQRLTRIGRRQLTLRHGNWTRRGRMKATEAKLLEFIKKAAIRGADISTNLFMD
jgi:hypothetical protein